jgi:zinc/manganese transport system substrate-binding protein
MTRWIAAALVALAALAAPAQAAPAGAAEPIKAVATFSILADLVRQVGGERVELTTLVGPDGDAHVFSPSPADGRRIADAKVVFANGLGLEGWLGRLVKASGGKARLVEVARGVTPLPDAGGHAGHGSGLSHAGGDPHAWQDVRNVKLYVAAIRDALADASPGDRATFATNAAAYLAKLDALDAEIRERIGRIPADRRRIITSHDAFRYFKAAYGLDFVAPQGVSTEAEASANDVARIIRQIRREKITAVFLENVTNARLLERIASETGAKIGGRVYSDALSGPDGPAATYLDMMRHNLAAFTAALVS